MVFKIDFYTSALITLLMLLVACSSSTNSSSGRGQIPTGIYSGVFNGQAGTPPRVTSTRAQLSLLVPTTTSDSVTTIDNANISGTLAITGGDRCFAGGTVTSGALNGDQMNLEITTTDGAVINMNGKVTSTSYDGTFTVDDNTTADDSTSCTTLSGGFEFDRA